MQNPHSHSPAPPSAAGATNHPSDPITALHNLSTVRTRMDSLQRFLHHSTTTKSPITPHHMHMVSNEISSALQQIILNAAALVAAGDSPETNLAFDHNEVKGNMKIEDDNEDEENCEIVEIDSVELLAEHVHFCEICGKGFKRDANLRMHMRAHGNQFKTPEALAKKPLDNNNNSKSEIFSGKSVRFSCPFEGCNRNKLHRKFRPLKSVICVRNHFKRSHCPKLYYCNRCHRKSFSVLSDLKSHLKHCGESSKWRCSCGTTFSRKDKLFGHIALFDGHMPALNGDEDDKGKQIVSDEGMDLMLKEEESRVNCLDEDLPDGFFDDLDDFGNYSFDEAFGFSSSTATYGSHP